MKAFLLYWICFCGAIIGFVFIAFNLITSMDYVGEVPLVTKVGLVGEIVIVAIGIIMYNYFSIPTH